MNRCFRRCRGEWFCTRGMVARQTEPGYTQCVRTEKSRAWTKRARAEAPRTGDYIISAWNVQQKRQTGCNRAQGSIFADVPLQLCAILHQEVFHLDFELPRCDSPDGGYNWTLTSFTVMWLFTGMWFSMATTRTSNVHFIFYTTSRDTIVKMS